MNADQSTINSEQTSPYRSYLLLLEEAASTIQTDSLYLWPRSIRGYDHQEKIAERVGVDDYYVEDSRSRSAMIIQQLKKLLTHKLIREDFSILDIACGDSIVLWQVKKAFPRSQCFGIDCDKGSFGTHEMVQKGGVELFRGFIQQLFVKDVEKTFDMVLMLNTYRGWDSADLRENEKKLPQLADQWVGRNARYVIVTATDVQVNCLSKLSFNISRLGKGEDNSHMVCFSKETLPLTYRDRWFVWRLMKLGYNFKFSLI